MKDFFKMLLLLSFSRRHYCSLVVLHCFEVRLSFVSVVTEATDVLLMIDYVYTRAINTTFNTGYSNKYPLTFSVFFSNRLEFQSEILHTYVVILCANNSLISPGVISKGTRGNAFPIVKVFKNAHELAVHALWTTLRTIFRPKMHLIARFCIYNTQIFLGVTLVPGPWTRMSI